MKMFRLLVAALCVFSVTVAYADTDTVDKNPDQTVLEKQFAEQMKAAKNPLAVALFKPTYVLPYYYTNSPDYAVYTNNTPNNQQVMHNEFKAQFSLLVPLAYNVFGVKDSAIEMAYTQLSYWQVYASSQYFRENDYNPEVFAQKLYKKWLFRTGIEHQSNGRGGAYERSWNRAYFTSAYSGRDWLASLKVWTLIFPSESSDLHNPDILHYLGREQIVLSKKCGNFVYSVEAQNIESGFTRGYIEPTVSYHLTNYMSVYLQGFSGYGQSLIEYNHRTNSVGIGIAFNNWI
ncbi:MAG: phospholipase A [Gammaproteobacteria bacterium]|nr:phospholipase A [Gammaproteobacteria bacterium]